MAQINGKKIAMLTHDYFEQVELTDPKKLLENAGATVHIISAAGPKLTGLHHIEKGDTFIADKIIENAKSQDYDAVVVPGGVVNADHLRIHPFAQQFVRQLHDAGKPVAAICHGPWLLVSAGLVQGRTLTSYPTLRDDISNAGGQWVDKEVVTEGNIITSRKPADIPAFCRAIIARLAEVGA